MLDLERAVAEWRRRMLAAGIKSPVLMEELESHLREDFRTFVKAGESETEAFERAVSRLGDSHSIRAEFGKIRGTTSAPIRIAAGMWSIAMVLFAVMLLRVRASGMLSYLAIAHIFCLTAGYVLAFLMGALGIWRVCSRQSQALDAGILWFSGAAAALAAMGAILGMIWGGDVGGSQLAGCCFGADGAVRGNSPRFYGDGYAKG